MAAAIGIDDLLTDNPAILDIVELKLFRVSEMLEDFSVLVGNRDSHGITSFL